MALQGGDSVFTEELLFAAIESLKIEFPGYTAKQVHEALVDKHGEQVCSLAGAKKVAAKVTKKLARVTPAPPTPSTNNTVGSKKAPKKRSKDSQRQGKPGVAGAELEDLEDPLAAIKAQLWRKWFVESIPMLGNQTPIQAVRTAEGRRLLEELFAFYEGMGGGGFNANIPARYARWKLGIGPGSDEEFAREEALLNGEHRNGQETCRKPQHEAKLKRRQSAMFVPKRCEVEGCEATEVDKCAKCKLVFYCSKEHQMQDWPRHKIDCRHLKESDLRRKYFNTAEELTKFPLGCFPLPPPQQGSTLRCFVCGAKDDEAQLGFTECCNSVVCDNEHEYEMMSYSQDHCKRSHCRYTLCGYHHTEGHVGDWRVCGQCKDDFLGGKLEGSARSWYSTNGFNMTPALESDLPQGSFITEPCGGCDGRITPGHDSVSTSFTRDGQVTLCSRCQ